jgi:hypothetical protein
LKLPLICLFALLSACGRRGEVEQRHGPLFRDIAPETGLVFQHVNGATGRFYMPEIMGAGAALFDYDGDGDLDIFLVQSGSLEDPSKGPGNRLFRNDLIPTGKLKFIDVTDEAGLRFSGYGMGAATGDFNNDGRVDLLVTNFGPNVLYLNLGNGKFKDVTAESPGVRKAGDWSTSASFFDYDRDGWPDLIILSYVDFSLMGNKKCFGPAGEPDYCTPVAYRAVPAALFHNEHGRFVDITANSGIDKARGPGLGVVAVDVDHDGWLDLFVANDTAANHLWMNQRNGTFTESALEHGVAYSEEGQPKAGMGVAAGDYDNDGDEDLVVLNLMREGASLFRNEGKGLFTDVSLASRIHAATLPYTGFGVDWFDFDNDGCLDLFFANGAVTLREQSQGSRYAEQNLLLRNPCSGDPFEDVTARAGDVMRLVEVSRGAAFGDIDNDGWVDILLTNNNGLVRLLHNESRAGAWLSVRVSPPGVRVGLYRSGQPTLWRRSHTDSSYLSASDPRVHFGLGGSPKIDKLVVEWPDGTRQEEPGPAANREVSIHKRNSAN